MATAYKHSENFAALKRIKEAIPTNLTSFQYLSVLDDLVYKAVFPIIEGTRFVDTYLAQVLGWQTQNPKRKTSGVGRQIFTAQITLYFLVDDPKPKLKIIQKLRLDRAILFELIRRWSSMACEIEELGLAHPTPENIMRLHELHAVCNVRRGYSLHSIYTHSNYWYREAARFKTRILEKYTRLCLNTAQRDYVQLGHRIDLEDIIQVYLLTASKAIDKCDTEKGVLTTHIQNWLLSAKNVVIANHLQGHQQHNKRSSTDPHHPHPHSGALVGSLMESVPLEDIESMAAEESDEQQSIENVASVRKIAKGFDPSGVARILMGITEVLSKEDLQILQSLTITPTEKTNGASRKRPTNLELQRRQG
jgi:hypothetical protein